MVQECYKYGDVTDNCLLQYLSMKLRLMDTHRSMAAAKVGQQQLYICSSINICDNVLFGG